MEKKEILSFFDAQPILILSTLGLDGSPQTRALVNIRNKNIAPQLQNHFKKTDRIMLMTNTHTDKIKEIRANSNASLYAYDNQYNGMLLTGTVSEVTDEAVKDDIWDHSFVMYYPDGRHGGDFSVIEFTPKNFKTYSGVGFVKKKGDVR